MGFDPSGGMAIYTNTSTKKALKDKLSLPTFYSYVLVVSKTNLKRQLPNMPRNHVQKNEYSVIVAYRNMHRDPSGLHTALCTMILNRK